MTPKSWEVELKFHVDEPQQLQEKLALHGFAMLELEQHEDIYLRHPSRDFARSDEAFRIRRVNDRAFLTYKGPRSAGQVKTREEIELAIDSSALAEWQLLVDRLGFQQVIPVRKTRRTFECRSKPDFLDLHVAMDCVDRLGNFAEIEIVIANDGGVEAAEQKVISAAKLLGLEKRQPKSYLSMLLETAGQ